jgi:hypothetical protein
LDAPILPGEDFVEFVRQSIMAAKPQRAT